MILMRGEDQRSDALKKVRGDGIQSTREVLACDRRVNFTTGKTMGAVSGMSVDFVI